MLRGRLAAGLLAMLLLVLSVSLQAPRQAYAQPALIQQPTNVANGATSVSVTISTPAANDLLIAICGARASVTITAPSGFSTAKNQSGTVSQGIFYKVAAGTESSISCGGGTSSTRWGIHVYEYSAMVASSPLDAVNTTSSTGSGTSASSGTVTTTNANDLLIAGVTIGANTSITAWSNSFTAENNFANGGSTSSRGTYGASDKTVTSTGSYSTTSTAGSGSWVGQIAAFKMVPPVLSTDIVDGSGNSVASPSAGMSATSKSFVCTTTTGTLGTGTQKIHANNYSGNPAWTLSIAATGGSTATWSDGSGHSYKFNNSTGSGCTNGQMTINPATGTLTPQSGCTNTNVSLGSSGSFVAGTTDSVALASATATAANNCYWDITGVSLSQKIPQLQTNGSYSINMTLTIVAN